MYCAVEEAFDNPLKQQMQRINRENKINNYRASLAKSVSECQHKYGLNQLQVGPMDYQFESSHGKNELPFYTAQGDYSKNNNLVGTSISELKQHELEKDDPFSDDALSLLDSDYSELLVNSDSEQLQKEKIAKFSHNHYINKFLKSILDDGNDLISLASSQDANVYDHIKACKYCRSQIGQKMKSHYTNEIKSTEVQSQVLQKRIGSFAIPDKVFGYNLKEIILIIAISIMIIFVLDLLVRIGRKTVNQT